MSTASKKRLLSELALDRCSESDLLEIQSAVTQQLAKRQKTLFSAEESLEREIQALRSDFNAIDWGCGGWKSEMTQNAVAQVENLDIGALYTSVLAVTGEERWNLALSLHAVVSSIISNTSDYGCKLVNGSCGETCPELAESLVRFWEKMLRDTAPNHVLQEIIDDVVDSTDPYGEWDQVKSKAKEQLESVERPEQDSEGSEERPMVIE